MKDLRETDINKKVVVATIEAGELAATMMTRVIVDLTIVRVTVLSVMVVSVMTIAGAIVVEAKAGVIIVTKVICAFLCFPLRHHVRSRYEL